MTYTILLAQYANEDNTSAIITTVEAGAVAVSEFDTPDLWLEMSIWGLPEPYQAPAIVLPSISDRQFFQQLALDGEITEDEAIAAVATGTVPSALAVAIATLPEAVQFAANMFLSGATTFERNHPMTLALAGLMSWDETMLNLLWVNAVSL